MIYECPECGRQERRPPTPAEIRWGPIGESYSAVCPECEAKGNAPTGAGARAAGPLPSCGSERVATEEPSAERVKP